MLEVDKLYCIENQYWYILKDYGNKYQVLFNGYKDNDKYYMDKYSKAYNILIGTLPVQPTPQQQKEINLAKIKYL